MRRILVLSAVVSAIASPGSGAAHSQAQDRAATVAKCHDLFGESLDARKLVFSIGTTHVLICDIGEDGQIEEVRLRPKRWFAPDASSTSSDDDTDLYVLDPQITALRASLDTLRDRGMVVDDPGTGFSSALKTSMYRLYGNAFESELSSDDGPVGNVIELTLYYFHRVDGHAAIVPKTRLEREMQWSFVAIDGERYVMRRCDTGIVRGHGRSSLMAAGPIRFD